jgi:hypothetical protein
LERRDVAVQNNEFETLVKEIETWFFANQDGEFCVGSDEHESIRTGDCSTAQTIIYTTKGRGIPRVAEFSGFQHPIAILSRYGLPSKHDLPFVRGCSPQRIFFGDCDPPDILIFAWLRAHVPIVWQGVSDDFLARHGNRNKNWIRIPLSESEQRAISYLPKLCPDFRTLVGEYCASVLESGFKIELEGAIVDQ